jgi:hypothetical protein
MMAATIESSSPLRVAAPRALFDGGFVAYNTTFRRSYDVGADGRFLVVQRAQPEASQSLVVVMHALDGERVAATKPSRELRR